FRLFGTPVRISPYFWLGTVLLGLGAWQAADLDPIWLLLWVASVLGSILWHEFGHVWAGRLFGARSYIVMHGLGGLAVGAANVPGTWRRIAVFLAGPAIQLALFGLVHLAWQTNPRQPYLRELLSILWWINLVWPLFNLVPVWPLDGGQITREVCAVAAPG